MDSFYMVHLLNLTILMSCAEPVTFSSPQVSTFKFSSSCSSPKINDKNLTSFTCKFLFSFGLTRREFLGLMDENG